MPPGDGMLKKQDRTLPEKSSKLHGFDLAWLLPG
jgi:hypothetical protein